MEKFKKVSSVIALFLSIATIIGLWPTVNGNTVPEPVVQTSPVVLEPFTKYENEPVKQTVLDVPELTAQDSKWIYETLKTYGQTPAADLIITVTDVNNCGSKASDDNTGGGCYYPELNILMISPTIVGTDAGTITLLHEYAHATGISDECGAEYFAHDLFEINSWSYPECYYNR